MAAKLISKEQARDLLKKESRVRSLLLKQAIKTNNKDLSKDQQASLISFIDVLLYFKLERKGYPSKRIDEDLIYKTLAEA